MYFCDVLWFDMMQKAFFNYWTAHGRGNNIAAGFDR